MKDARVRAEQAVRESVARLGVMAASRPAHLSEEDGTLRVALRAHARALGDDVPRGEEGEEPRRLIEAAAYVRWHRLLFVRFLAERSLLRHPDQPDIALTLRDCAEFARDEGVDDAYALAARYASRWLPAVFDETDPACQLELSPEHENALRMLVEDLPAPVFAASDSLGWTYQYWRAAEKDAINASGVKIGADELPAVTQLFTEPYMVRFLLDNTLGAWWAGKRFAEEPELAMAPDEAALRARLALPGADWAWLRFVREEDEGPWRPAAGTFPDWPRNAAELTLLDPCCGSGHFLTEALPILSTLRQAEDATMGASVAVAAVLRENLHGLELDGRCVQIASFAVALSAWTTGGWQSLPNPHIAWVGGAPRYTRAEFEALGNGDAELRRSLGSLHELFRHAPLLGSLIEVSGGDLVMRANLSGVEAAMARLAAREDADADRHEGAIAARGMADAAALLSRRWVLQITNVPYLGRGKQSAELKDYIARRFPHGKADLANAMLERMLCSADYGSSIATVTPHNWLFLSGYKKFRAELLTSYSFQLLATLGEEAWEDFGDRGPPALLSVLSNTAPGEDEKHYFIDALPIPKREDKSKALKEIGDFLLQGEQYSNPDHRITSEPPSSLPLLGEYASGFAGVCTGDYPKFGRYFWELTEFGNKWELQATTVECSTAFGGLSNALLWEHDRGQLRSDVEEKLGATGAGAWLRGEAAWGKQGVLVSSMRTLAVTRYLGTLWDNNAGVIIPNNPNHLPAVWAFCSSEEFQKEVRRIDRKLNVTNATLVKVPFDLDRWSKVAHEEFSEGLPAPRSDDPTQWVFHGHPGHASVGTALHVALARLAGYRWPAEIDTGMPLSKEAREWATEVAKWTLSDTDGLLPLVACAGERPLAQRLRDLCALTFEDWTADLEHRLVREADEKLGGFSRRSEPTIEDWLRNRAFRQHCKLFNERPFLWQVWDGRSDGFSTFIHYHRLGRRNLEKLTFTLLGDWLNRSEADSNAGIVEAGRVLQSKLRAILEGERPFDIFVRWKSLTRQPQGWEPDLDDGVRMNIRPFVMAEVLRDTVNVHWRKDRGSDVASAPWFKVHGGERINDHHTTLAEKRAAREAAQKRLEPAE
jgi:hypothetical protein